MKNEKLVEIRKILHQHPEISGNESQTSAYISKLITEINPDFKLEKLKDNSLIASLGNLNGKHISFRCELDALPICEVNDFDHKSLIDGVSHKCGHDGHMTILLSLIDRLKELDLSKHLVSLIFQAAEENGNGAKYVIENAKLFKLSKPDYIFALHNIPGYPENEIIIKEGVFTPEVRSVKFRFKGKTAHASEPQKGMNPAYALSQLIEKSKEKVEIYVLSEDFNLITPIYAKLGDEAYGIAAGYAELGFTMRSWNKELAVTTANWIEKTAEKIGHEHRIQVSYECFEEFVSINNNQFCCDKIRTAAQKLKLSVHEKTDPMAFGEDFGLFTTEFNCAMFGIGAGLHSSALHYPDYDFNDALIEPASNMFLEILNQLLHD